MLYNVHHNSCDTFNKDMTIPPDITPVTLDSSNAIHVSGRIWQEGESVTCVFQDTFNCMYTYIYAHYIYHVHSCMSSQKRRREHSLGDIPLPSSDCAFRVVIFCVVITSLLLMGTDGCRMFPIWVRLASLSLSHSFISATHFLLASSIKDCNFFICCTVRTYMYMCVYTCSYM